MKEVLWSETIQWKQWQITVVVSSLGLHGVAFARDLPGLGSTLTDRERTAPFSSPFRQYFGRQSRDLSVPIDWHGTAFQLTVWRALITIPYGQVITYRALADLIGRPSAVRAVARSVALNPWPIIVPCHRVVGSDGTLTGYRGGLALKQALLELEGVSGIVARGHERYAF